MPTVFRCLTAALFAFAVAIPARAQGTSPVLFDRHMTAGAAATVTTTLGEAIARAEDAIVPPRPVAERGLARRSLNISYRLSKLFLFDIPQEAWLVVATHEVMGHGARLRERFDGSIRYAVAAPSPYGSGGGATYFRFDREPTVPELLSVSAGGMEADAVAARLIAGRAFAEGRMRFRDAIRYLLFELDTPTYVWDTGDDLDAQSAGHDVAQFLRTYNDVAAAAGAQAIEARTLRRQALASLANPMIAFAAVGIGRYVWNGQSDVRVPALSIGGVGHLPLVRYQLAPYGTEWAVTNLMSGARWPTRVEVRFGRAPGTRPWGVSVERHGLATWRSWRLDAGIDFWRQPEIAARTAAATRPLRTGIETRGRVERPVLPVGFSQRRASIIIDIGVKAAGFVPGEPIGGGLVARVGVGIPLR